MYLNVVPSADCSMHQIRVPELLRRSFKLDYGDFLIFNTDVGDLSVQVIKSTYEDMIEYGDRHAFVNEHSPILDSKNSDVFIQPHELTVGCDPELFLLNRKTHRVLPAYRILHKESQFGSDGDLAELRPDYALSPEQLIVNIRKVISNIPYKIPLSLSPYASSWYALRACGFHIHLGLPIELLSFAVDETDTFLKNIVSALDYFTGIPAAALDPDNRRRFSKKYGESGDYKLSMRTLEYRTPGGFHLKSPAYARSLITSAFGIVEEIIKDAEEASGGWLDASKIVDFNYFRERYNLPSKKYIKSVYASKDRSELKNETIKIHEKLNTLIGNDAKFVVKERHQNEQPFLCEWLKDET